MAGQQYPVRLDLNQPTTPAAPVQGYPIRLDLSGSGPVQAIPAAPAPPVSDMRQAVLNSVVGGIPLVGPALAGFLPRMFGSGGDLPPAGKAAPAPAVATPATAATTTPSGATLPAFGVPSDLRTAAAKVAMNMIDNSSRTGISPQQLQLLAGLSPVPQHYTGKDVIGMQALDAQNTLFSQALKDAGTQMTDAQKQQEAVYLGALQKRADALRELYSVKDDPLDPSQAAASAAAAAAAAR